MVAAHPSMGDVGSEDRESVALRNDTVDVRCVSVNCRVQSSSHDRYQSNVPERGSLASVASGPKRSDYVVNMGCLVVEGHWRDSMRCSDCHNCVHGSVLKVVESENGACDYPAHTMTNDKDRSGSCCAAIVRVQ